MGIKAASQKSSELIVQPAGKNPFSRRFIELNAERRFDPENIIVAYNAVRDEHPRAVLLPAGLAEEAFYVVADWNINLYALVKIIDSIGYRATVKLTSIARSTLFRYSQVHEKMESQIEINWSEDAVEDPQAPLPSTAEFQALMSQMIDELSQARNDSLAPILVDPLSFSGILKNYLDRIEALFTDCVSSYSGNPDLQNRLFQQTQNWLDTAISLFERLLQLDDDKPATSTFTICPVTIGMPDSKRVNSLTPEGMHQLVCAEFVAEQGAPLTEDQKPRFLEAAERLGISRELAERNVEMSVAKADHVYGRAQNFEQFSPRGERLSFDRASFNIGDDSREIRQVERVALKKIRRALQPARDTFYRENENLPDSLLAFQT